MARNWGYKNRIAMISVLLVLFISFTPQIVQAAASIVATFNPVSLTESNLNGAIIRITMSNSTYVQNLLISHFQLVNAPSGTAITSVTRVSNTIADLYIYFDGTDFDNNIANFKVTALAASNLANNNCSTTNKTITAIVESTGSNAVITINPNTINQTSLNNALIFISIQGMSFNPGLNIGHFQLNNAPAGVSISEAYYLDSTKAKLYLAYDGTNFNTDINNFSINLLPAGNLDNFTVTSNNIVIKSQQAVEGFGTYISSGNSNVDQIILSGYNTQLNRLYTNFSLTTGKTVASNNTATFKYIINIIDGNSGLVIGSSGSYSTPENVVAATGATNVAVNNKYIDLTSSLPINYRILIIIVDTSVT